MKKLLLSASVAFLSFSAMAQNTWKPDPMHSSINFNIKHMGINLIPGMFDKYTGTVVSSRKDLTDAKIEFTVDAASINTHVEPRDKHLRTADFFEVEKYPELRFKSTKMVKAGKSGKYLLYGNMTIKDVTRPVVFNVTYGGMAKDQQGNEKLGFTATTTINRLDYHINYDPTGTGVAKEVQIQLNLELVKG